MVIEHQSISEYFFGNAFSADSLFCDLSPETQKSLNAIKEKKQFPVNTIIFASGQIPCCIYLLLEGEAQIFTNPELHGKNPVRSIATNEILGLTETIADLPYEISLKTVSPCLFESIGRDDFIRFLQTEPEACFRLLQILGANIQKIFQIFARQQ